MNANDQLSLAQRDLCNLLLGNPALLVVPISTFKAMMVEDVAREGTDIWTDRSGMNKRGCAIQVRMPALRAQYGNVPGPQYQAEYTVRVFEDTVENNTGLTAESIALEILQWLDGAMITGNSTITADEKGTALRPVYDYPDRFCYDVVFIAQSPQDSRDRTIAPTFSDDGHGNVTLACADNQYTAIYYSVNEALPVAGVAAAYVEPFAVKNGDTVRFFALAPGKLPSFISQAIVSINS